MTELTLSYQPNEVSPPGATLAELLDERGIAQAELARRMGRPLNAVNEMVLGAKEITEDTALELERVLGTPAHFWLAREARYREFLARQRDAGRAESRITWLESLPLKQLQEIGALPPGRITPSFKASLIPSGEATPKKRRAGSLGQIDLTAAAVRAFAKEIEVHPGIVVGCLQHLGLVNYASPLTKLKDRYEIAAK